MNNLQLTFKWTDGNDLDFIEFSSKLEEYFNELVGGEQNRKSFIPYNSLSNIHDVLIAYVNSKAVGCASFKKYSYNTVEIKRVYVDKAFRRLGIAKQLMAKLETAALAKGYSRLILQTREACTEAVALYKSIGYHITDNYEPYTDMPLAVCYEKKL